MLIDHSQTYKGISLRNLPHRLRLRTILSMLDKRSLSGDMRFADFGCSNGYITNIIAKRYGIKNASGFDYEEDHMVAARERYPEIAFDTINLKTAKGTENFDLVTCFETLEHVGDVENALSHLLSSTRKGGLLFVSVPIEIGFRGLVKFMAKSIIYRFRYQSDLDELVGDKIGLKYFLALLFNKDISRFREKRQRWGTHYGFDYRVVDSFFRKRQVSISVINRFTSRFYLIKV